MPACTLEPLCDVLDDGRIRVDLDNVAAPMDCVLARSVGSDHEDCRLCTLEVDLALVLAQPFLTLGPGAAQTGNQLHRTRLFPPLKRRRTASSGTGWGGTVREPKPATAQSPPRIHRTKFSLLLRKRINRLSSGTSKSHSKLELNQGM